MAIKFFTKFPKFQYDIDGEGYNLLLTNILKNVDVDDSGVDDSANYTFYNIQDGERPDTVSYKLYGIPDYYWTLFILNNDLRAGINQGWPIPQNQREEIYIRDYDPYSVITFISNIESSSIHRLISVLPLDKKYLEYLRLENSSRTQSAKISRYDYTRQQLIIYDIIVNSTGNLASSRDSFIQSQFYSLAWKNPYEVGSDEYITCEELKREFADSAFEVYTSMRYLTDIPVEEFIFGGIYTPANAKFRWTNYRNAAYTYYKNSSIINLDEVVTDEFGRIYSAIYNVWYGSQQTISEADGERIPTTAYDVLNDPNIIEPTYISYFEEEEYLNTLKEKIKVIHPSRIGSFSKDYFRILNGRLS